MPSKIDAARKALEAAQEQVTSWTVTLAAARQEQAVHESDAGAVVLADPDRLDGVAETSARLAGKVRLAEEAVQAAERSLVDRRRDLMILAAEEVERRRDARQRDLDRHMAQREELIAALAEHEGDAVRTVFDRPGWWEPPFEEQRPGASWAVPRSATLTSEVAELRDQAAAIRAAVDDITPARLEQLLAAVFLDGPEAKELNVRREAQQAEQARREAERIERGRIQEGVVAEIRRLQVAALRASGASDRAEPRVHPTQFLRAARQQLDVHGRVDDRPVLIRALSLAIDPNASDHHPKRREADAEAERLLSAIEAAPDAADQVDALDAEREAVTA